MKKKYIVEKNYIKDEETDTYLGLDVVCNLLNDKEEIIEEYTREDQRLSRIISELHTENHQLRKRNEILVWIIKQYADLLHQYNEIFREE